jgi:Acyl-CoA dehydrogenase, C-terminal domain
VDARPTPEQRALTEAADRLALRLGPSTVEDLDDGDRRHRLDAALAQAGWRELRTGTSTVALASGVEAAVVTRALARRACDTAFVGPVLAHDLLRRAGGDVGDANPTVVVTSDLRRLAVVDSPALACRTVAVDTAASRSGLLLVADGAGFGVAAVPLGAAVEGVDLTRSIVPIGAGTAVAKVATEVIVSVDDVTAWTALAVTLTAADLVGAMEGALELATVYAAQRRQFGAAIGSYQAVQHLLAEAHTLAEGAVSAMYHAAWAADALPPDAARQAAAVAKAYAARAARMVCETAIQVHGGIGNTWECLAHVFLRRTLLATELFGGDGAQLALLAQQRWGATYGLR